MCYAGGMAAPEALSVPGDSTAPEAAAVPEAGAASQRLPQLIPVAQLIAVVLGVAGIIWHQQQTTDNLRTELRTEIAGVETSLRDEIASFETSLRDEIASFETSLRDEINGVETSLRDEINGVETSLRDEINGVETGLGAEMTSLRAEVAENGQRLGRIEGFLGIGVPDASPPSSP